MWFTKKIIDLILYGNFWIALAALAMALQSTYIFGEELSWNPIPAIVFFATWLLYSMHRIVGILRLKDFLKLERFSVISKFRSHIIVYAILAAIGTGWYFFQVSFQVQLSIFLPALFSIAYVFPFFRKQKRLRDFNQIKIYVIAFIWAWVTVVVPAVAYDTIFTGAVLLMFIERALFIFAITLPFDIRDLKVDGHSEVRTIPAVIGIIKTRQLSYILLVIGLCLIFINWYLGFYNTGILTGLIISFISTAVLIRNTSLDKHDYFYSGLLDGTMVLQLLLILLMDYLINI